MALITCPACGSDVSSDAPACPKCGHPIAFANKNSQKSHITDWVIVVVVLATVFGLVSYLPSSSGVNSHGGATVAIKHKKVSATPRASAPPPSTPVHYYSYEKDGEYGYEQPLSQNQIDAGMASAPLVMIRYLGKLRGVYRFEVVEGRVTEVFSCSLPCRYITQRNYYYNPYIGSQFINKETFPAGNTIAAAVMYDAMNGQLRVYGARRHAAYVAWLAAQQRRPPYVTTAVQFMKSATYNRDAFKRTLKGRRVQVSGIVAQVAVSTGSVSETVVWLKSSPELILNFLHSEDAMIRSLHRGQSITALCPVMHDWFIGYPDGKDCKLLVPKKTRFESRQSSSHPST